MRKFEYCQIDYFNYPSEDDLNKMGKKDVNQYVLKHLKKKFFDDDLAYSYTKKIHKATFKREII